MLSGSQALWLAVLVLGMIVTAPAPAATRCERLIGALCDRITAATCGESGDLTTKNPATTPSASDVGAAVAAIATTGHIGKPLITIAGTMDALLPINLHARAHARAAAAVLTEQGDAIGRRPERRDRPAYRLYEVQNGNHIETYKDIFSQLALIQPHAQKAFDLPIDSVERGDGLPTDQHIPRGGSVASSPARLGHCAQLFVP
jgi:3HB-oligomer hydrolase (3HBOH)